MGLGGALEVGLQGSKTSPFLGKRPRAWAQASLSQVLGAQGQLRRAMAPALHRPGDAIHPSPKWSPEFPSPDPQGHRRSARGG